jgi:hypothetical protein
VSVTTCSNVTHLCAHSFDMQMRRRMTTAPPSRLRVSVTLVGPLHRWHFIVSSLPGTTSSVGRTREAVSEAHGGYGSSVELARKNGG